MVGTLNQLRGRTVYVDLIRTLAIAGVILVHASGRWIVTLQEMNMVEVVSWAVVDIYQSVAVIGVPLFLMLSGALLLQPGKENESLGVFFKKRWARIGLPFFFWCTAYFLWVFLVQDLPFRPIVVVQGLLVGPYTHFWYIYVLIGLYLLTPMLRIFIAHANQTLIKYGIAVWFVGTAVLPFFAVLSEFQLHPSIFTITGYVGYFLLGAYLPTVQIRRKTLLSLMVLGIALTAVSTAVMASTVGGTERYFFQEYLSPTVILTSVMAFLLLLNVQPPSVQKDAGTSKVHALVKLIGQNTLPIYLFHVMVIECFQKGYFGFEINRTTIDPVVGVPLLTVITLFVSFAVIVALKKVPYLKQLIG